jgi:cytoskeletal protein CcmA (bactofilin family)
MLRSDTLFGKREGATGNTLNTPNSPLTGSTLGQSAGAKPASSASSAHAQAESTKTTAPASVPQPVQAVDTAGQEEGGSKLIVGPNIKLKGVEITDCDTIVVEGFVEATIYSRVIQISRQGAFKGSAEIDIAEIHGEFNGDLTVRQKLVICSTGKVSGKIRYGKLVIEEGGQLSGDVQMDVPGTARISAVAAVAAVPTLTDQVRTQLPQASVVHS